MLLQLSCLLSLLFTCETGSKLKHDVLKKFFSILMVVLMVLHPASPVASVLKYHGKIWHNFVVPHLAIPNFASAKILLPLARHLKEGRGTTIFGLPRLQNCLSRLCPSPFGTPAMGYRCVCTTGAVQHKAEVQSKSQRGKLFSDMSQAPFAAVNKVRGVQAFSAPSVLRLSSWYRQRFNVSQQ